MATKKTENTIEIPALKMVDTVIRVVGDTPLIVHKWSEKAKKEIRDKQMGKATKKKAPKDPVEDFIDTLYWLDGEPEEKTEEGFNKAMEAGARIGFPATAFKQSAIMGATRSGADIKSTVARATFFIPVEMVEIHHNGVEMREDMVRVGGISKTADIRYRAQLNGWWADIPIRFNADVITLEQIVNLFQLGGFSCGVGEWRNEKDGIFGAYHVESAA